MPKPISLKAVLKVLNEKGLFFVSQKGSHAKYRTHGQPEVDRYRQTWKETNTVWNVSVDLVAIGA